MSNQLQAERALAQARVTNELSKRLQGRLEKEAAASTAVRAAAGEAADAMVKNERIFANQKDAVVEKIASDDGGHLASLELARNLSCHRNAAEVEQIGSPVGQEKTAKARVSGAPTSDFDETPEGRAFRERLCGAGAA